MAVEWRETPLLMGLETKSETMKIVLATQNKHKVKEILQIWGELPFEVLTLEAFPDFPAVVEDGRTFLDNSLKKAREVCRYTGLIAVADDSGIEVDGLNGAPGVYSARFAGENASDDENNQKLLECLMHFSAEHPARKARFRCVASIASPSGEEWHCEGSLEGRVLANLRGFQGFGYDPLFYLPDHGLTTAELSLEEKNLISHRAKAFRKLKDLLIKIL